jgi:hypothetical protein
MSKHKWKPVGGSDTDTNFCATCGVVRFTTYTGAGKVYEYGAERNRKEPRCITVQCSLKLRFVLALSVALLWSCDCNYYYSKAQRKCAGKTLGDTIHGTALAPSVIVDTVFVPGRDTVIVKEGQLTMKYFYDRQRDTVYLRGKCDTLRVPFAVPCTHTVPQFSWGAFLYGLRWPLALFALVIVAGLYMAYRIFTHPPLKLYTPNDKEHNR